MIALPRVCRKTNFFRGSLRGAKHLRRSARLWSCVCALGFGVFLPTSGQTQVSISYQKEPSDKSVLIRPAVPALSNITHARKRVGYALAKDFASAACNGSLAENQAQARKLGFTLPVSKGVLAHKKYRAQFWQITKGRKHSCGLYLVTSFVPLGFMNKTAFTAIFAHEKSRNLQEIDAPPMYYVYRVPPAGKNKLSDTYVLPLNSKRRYWVGKVAPAGRHDLIAIVFETRK